MNFLAPADLSSAPEGIADIGIRPEDLGLAPPDQALPHDLAAHCERLGEVTIVHLRLPRGGLVVAKLRGDAGVNSGDGIFLTTWAAAFL